MKKGLDESVSHFDDGDNDTKHSKETPHIFQVGSCLRELTFFFANMLKCLILMSCVVFESIQSDSQELLLYVQCNFIRHPEESR